MDSIFLMEEQGDQKKLNVIYYRIVDLWERLCIKHTTLLEKTCDEYFALLESNLDKLEKIVADKQNIIEEISHLEKLRKSLIDELQSSFKEFGREVRVKSVSDLIVIMQKFERQENRKHLFRLNQQLINIIEQIQEQNKKNMLFINKAVLSLNEITESIAGNAKQFTTYTAQGTARQSSEKI